MTATQFLNFLSEQQISDETVLRRVVALFQRTLGSLFGNASVRRRNRRYEIDVAVYERPTLGGKPYQAPERQIKEWIRQAALRAHPRLYKRLTVNIEPWIIGRKSRRLFAPVKIIVDASPAAA